MKKVYINHNGGYYLLNNLVFEIKESWEMRFRDVMSIVNECKNGRLEGYELRALSEKGIPIVRIISDKRDWTTSFTFRKIQNKQIKMKRVRKYVRERMDNSINADIKNYTE